MNYINLYFMTRLYNFIIIIFIIINLNFKYNHLAINKAKIFFLYFNSFYYFYYKFFGLLSIFSIINKL